MAHASRHARELMFRILSNGERSVGQPYVGRELYFTLNRAFDRSLRQLLLFDLTESTTVIVDTVRAGLSLHESWSEPALQDDLTRYLEYRIERRLFRIWSDLLRGLRAAASDFLEHAEGQEWMTNNPTHKIGPGPRNSSTTLFVYPSSNRLQQYFNASFTVATGPGIQMCDQEIVVKKLLKPLLRGLEWQQCFREPGSAYAHNKRDALFTLARTLLSIVAAECRRNHIKNDLTGRWFVSNQPINGFDRYGKPRITLTRQLLSSHFRLKAIRGTVQIKVADQQPVYFATRPAGDHESDSGASDGEVGLAGDDDLDLL